MAGSFDKDGHLDPNRGLIVVCVGKKGSGKSVMGLALAMGYPYDIVVVDVAGDDGPMPGSGSSGSHDVVELRGRVDELPASWPEDERREDDHGRPRPMILRYVPDPGSPTYHEDMAHCVALAMKHGRCMILCHEANEMIPSTGKLPPPVRRFLRFNRHTQTTGVFCGPRVITMDRLVLGQADLLYVFELNVPEDRDRIAGEIGWNPADFTAAVEDLGPHEYLLFDARRPKPEEGEEDLRLVHYPPLPRAYVTAVERWAKGQAPQQIRYGEAA